MNDDYYRFQSCHATSRHGAGTGTAQAVYNHDEALFHCSLAATITVSATANPSFSAAIKSKERFLSAKLHLQ
jgi:hypothetical protein